MKIPVLGLALAIMAPVCWAGNDGIEWVSRIAKSARELPYSGVYLHQVAETTSTSRITHMLDRHGVEHEKIELLDGPSYEVVRRDQEMFCYHPDAKTVRVDRRVSGRFFPALISGSPDAVAESYNIKLGSLDRVAGYECQWVMLEPKDTMRYLHKLCAEINSGLLLRARTFNERNQLVEQFMFTQLEMNRMVARDAVKSRYENSAGWQKDYAVLFKRLNADTQWLMGNIPAGFKKVMEVARSLVGRPQPVTQVVYSDGLSQVSVFVEPTQGQPAVPVSGVITTQISEEGLTSVASRPMLDFQVTVMGEVPIATVQAIAEGVTRRTK